MDTSGPGPAAVPVPESIVLAGGRVVTPGGIVDPGWVEVRSGRIAAVGRGRPTQAGTDLGGAWVVPGFVDLHVHGGGGYDFGASPAELDGGVAYHRSRGTTRTLVSLVAAPLEDLCEQLGWIAARSAAGPGPGGHVIGAHIEGPFLSQLRCGAQNPAYLIPPRRDILARLLAAGRGHVRVVTLAPELPGAADVIDGLVAAGVVAAVGHTDASYEQAADAFGRGAGLATHLFNGMRPLHHREPGPVLAALDAGVACEVINDGVHVHPSVLRLVLARGRDRLVLVTDAMAAAGAPDGAYELGGQAVVVAAGQARLASDGSLAGSTLSMDQAFRRAVLDGVDIEVAAVAASANPARVLGIGDRCGSIAVGLDADLVVLDDDLVVQRVMGGGSWSTPG